jgi:hypothetical protein
MLGVQSYFVKPQGADELQALLKRLYEYWVQCEVPQTTETGKPLRTDSRGKLGERFPQRGD